MLEGIITKGIGGFYYISTSKGIIESHARGLFREEKLKPLIGDRVMIRISDEDGKGYIEEILPRTSQLTRPSVANVTHVVIVMSIENPNLNNWLLDRFIMMVEYKGLKTTICINKSDLNMEEAKKIRDIYRTAGYNVILTNAIDDINIDLVEKELFGEISVFAGPSGAGKSSMLNQIGKDFKLEVGGLSEKTGRGKHTTRHVELLPLGDNSYVLDTPGFSSLNLDFLEDERNIRFYFKEINKYAKDCKFLSCLHLNEPKCNVKKMVEEGKISRSRYENYLSFLSEVKKNRRY